MTKRCLKKGTHMRVLGIMQQEKTLAAVCWFLAENRSAVLSFGAEHACLEALH